MTRKKFGEAVIETLGGPEFVTRSGPKMPFGIIAAPSHLTVPQVARILGITREAIHDRLRRGTLTFGLWYGEKMIPSREVVEAKLKKTESRKVSATPKE